ncbi:hypothetical protein MUP95_08390, partial [bacterium]|nr:hypothetical protein [bacterium]
TIAWGKFIPNPNNKLGRIIKKAIKNILLPHRSKALEFGVRHQLPSYVLSLDDEPFGPSERLIKLSLSAAGRAPDIRLDDIIERTADQDMKRYLGCWPGEHYRLIAAFVDVLRPNVIIEIGTATGASALCMKKFLPLHGKIITYDIVEWDFYPDTLLKKSDLDERMHHRVVDLANPLEADTQMQDLQTGELIFVDAAKDGVIERKFLELLDRAAFKTPPIVIFDDIRMINMIQIWRDICHPKIDLTSFGHWSGTGVVEWNSKP